MRFAGFLPLLFAPLLSSCVEHYVIAQSPANATLRISASIDSRPGGYAIAQAFADRTCAKTGSGNRLAFFSTRPGIQGKGDPHEGVDVPVLSGRELVFTLHFNDGSSGRYWDTCDATYAMVPEPGARYHAHLELVPDACQISIMQVGPDGSETPLDSAKLARVEPSCFNSING